MNNIHYYIIYLRSISCLNLNFPISEIISLARSIIRITIRVTFIFRHLRNQLTYLTLPIMGKSISLLCQEYTVLQQSIKVYSLNKM